MGNESEKPGCYDTPRACVCARGVNTIYPPNPRPLRLWAGGIGIPLRFYDNDPRLDNPGQGDTTVGQDNWDVAFDFATLADLARQLDGGFSLPTHSCGNWVFDCGPIEDNQITRLAINVHGAPGVADIDNAVGKDVSASFLTDERMLSAATVSRKKPDLDTILKKLGWRATVFFMCCLTGEGPAGEDFLKAISAAWAAKEITVVAYRAILYSSAGKGDQLKVDGSCHAGCRETHFPKGGTDGHDERPYELPGQWNNLRLLPWAAATTPHARVALKGAITRDGVAAAFDGSCAGNH